jgi:hypothetical protein
MVAIVAGAMRHARQRRQHMGRRGSETGVGVGGVWWRV